MELLYTALTPLAANPLFNVLPFQQNSMVLGCPLFFAELTTDLKLSSGDDLANNVVDQLVEDSDYNLISKQFYNDIGLAQRSPIDLVANQSYRVGVNKELCSSAKK